MSANSGDSGSAIAEVVEPTSDFSETWSLNKGGGGGRAVASAAVK